MDVTLGLTGVMWVGIAIFLGILGWKLVNMGLTAGSLKILKVGAVASILIATVAFGMWAVTPAATVDPTGVSWDVDVVSSDSNVIKMSDYSFKVLCVYDISDADLTVATQHANFTVTITRTDTNIIDATSIGKFTDYGTKTNVTTGQSYAGMELNADGSYNVNFTSSQNVVTDTQIVVPYDKKLSADTFTLTTEPSSLAVVSCVEQAGVTTTWIVGGQTITVEYVHHDTQG